MKQMMKATLLSASLLSAGILYAANPAEIKPHKLASEIQEMKASEFISNLQSSSDPATLSILIKMYINQTRQIELQKDELSQLKLANYQLARIAAQRGA